MSIRTARLLNAVFNTVIVLFWAAFAYAILGPTICLIGLALAGLYLVGAAMDGWR